MFHWIKYRLSQWRYANELNLKRFHFVPCILQIHADNMSRVLHLCMIPGRNACTIWIWSNLPSCITNALTYMTYVLECCKNLSHGTYSTLLLVYLWTHDLWTDLLSSRCRAGSDRSWFVWSRIPASVHAFLCSSGVPARHGGQCGLRLLAGKVYAKKITTRNFPLEADIVCASFM